MSLGIVFLIHLLGENMNGPGTKRLAKVLKIKTPPVNHEGGSKGSAHSVKVKSARPKRRFNPFALLFRILAFIFVLCLIGVGALYFMLSRGAISNAQLRTQIENQLSSALGPNLEVASSEAKIAFGKSGLIALEVSDLQVLREDKTNLGIVDTVTVAVKTLPLLSGEVVAQSLNLDGAAIAIEPYIPSFDSGNSPWPEAFDFSTIFRSLGDVMGDLARTLDEAGLEKVHLSNTKLNGFDMLGWAATDARIVQLDLERRAGDDQQIVFELKLEIGSSIWTGSGAWQNGQDGGRVFSMVVDGVRLSDFPKIVLENNKRLEMTNSLRFKLSAPFEVDGESKQATLKVEVLDGSTTIDNQMVAHLLGAELNFRYFPKKNQIELEPSPVQLKNTSFQLLGGVKFPVKKTLAETDDKPVFQIIANDLVPFGLFDGNPGAPGAAGVSGWVDAKNKTLNAKTLQLITEEGKVQGTGAILFGDDKPAFHAELKTDEISVSALKKFWPAFLAPDFRKWSSKNLITGKLTDSSFKINFTPGLLGNRDRYTQDTLSGDVNVTDATIKTVGALPLLTKAVAKIRVTGTKTSISLKSGRLDLGKSGVVKVTGGTMNIGSYAKPKIQTLLKVAVAGDAKAIVQLGTLNPLSYSKALNLQPQQCSGEIKATIVTKFGLKQIAKKGIDEWNATIDINNGALKNQLFGYKVDNVDVKIKASKGTAKIDGTANINGLPAKLALVEKFGGSKASKREISLILDDAARKRLGADTGDVVRGPVEVVVKTLPDGSQKISANLNRAKLNLPWVGWSKGAGIPGKATFVLKRNKGVSSISKLRVDGKGFSATGKLKLDKSGLRAAAFKKVKLNATDDFDVDVARLKSGYSVKFNARSYDGRALIQSFLQNEGKRSKRGARVDLDGQISRLVGFGGQSLNNVRVNLKQHGTEIQRAQVEGTGAGKAPLVFSLYPVAGGSKIDLSTSNAGSMLRFLDLYTRARGGTINANLVRDDSTVYTGVVVAKNFTLLEEPKLAALLAKPEAPRDLSNRSDIVQAIKQIKTDRAKVDRLQANIKMGNGSLTILRGRLSGGDAGAEFSGIVYDKRNRMKIRGTYLPGRTLNKLMSKIPVLGWALGEGKVSGLLGITFKLSGPYRNPKLRVNPLSIITPGVFRKIFR